jgi:hypothetical protein
LFKEDFEAADFFTKRLLDACPEGSTIQYTESSGSPEAYDSSIFTRDYLDSHTIATTRLAQAANEQGIEILFSLNSVVMRY